MDCPNFSRTIAGLSLTVGLVVVGMRVPDRLTAQPLPVNPEPRLTPLPARLQLPAVVVDVVKQTASREFGVLVARLQIVRTTEQQWPDGCLGLGGANELCTQAIVPGYRVEVSDGVQTWFYRTDARGQIVRLEGASDPRLPVAVANKLVNQVAEDTGLPAATLKVTAVKPRVFDGCLGIYRPGQACTKIAIQGWQAIVKGQLRTWVYHLNQNATQIQRNRTASGAKNSVRVAFELFGVPTDTIDTNIVFQRTISGGLLGEVQTTTLTADGQVTSFRSSPWIKTRPVIVTTLKPRQVMRFKQLLENHRFPNLNGLSYLTEAVLADYPTTMLRTPTHAVQYVDLEQRSLPRSLQRIIGHWEMLIKADTSDGSR